LHQYQTYSDLPDIVETAAPQIVFHLASLFLSQHCYEDVANLIESNISLTAHLVEAMIQNNVKLLINTGTTWQHYQNRSYSPVNLYAATKQAAEDVIQYYHEAHALHCITLTLFDTYGPDDIRPKLLNVLKSAALSGNQLPLSPGEQFMNLVHVDDVVRAYLMAADRLIPHQNSGPFLEKYAIAADACVTVKDLVLLFETIAGTKLNMVWGERPYRDREIITPWALSNRLPGWIPEVSLREGLTAFIKGM
jgi:nucleoside-diphosphate-sugar epimerase